MSSQQGKFMIQNLSDVFTQDPKSNLAQLLNAIGSELDKIDPVQLGLALQRAISTATGSYLDAMGQDWVVSRRYQESDASYRSRILAALPIYMSGPTKAAMASVVAAFVGGVAPIIIEYGPDNFIMGISKMGQFVFMAAPDPFTFQVQVQNPQNIAYKISDMEAAVNKAKPARSTATFIHKGGV